MLRTIPLVARYFFSHVANSRSDTRLFLASDKRNTPWPVFTNGIIGLSATIAIATCALDRVRDNGATPDAERAQMTSVCHTHGENYHFKFVNVHAAAIRRKDAVLVGVTFEREDVAAPGSVGMREKMMALAIIMIIPSLLGEASPRIFGFCVSTSFRSARFSSQGSYIVYIYIFIYIHVVCFPFHLFLSPPASLSFHDIVVLVKI